MNDISELIIKNLIQNERYCRAVMPFLKLEYFENKDRFVFKLICTFVTKYNTLPNCTALQYEFGNLDKQPENAQEIVEYIDLLFTITDDDKRVDETWLLSTTEEWCKDRAVYLGVIQSIEIINGTDVETPQSAIPTILSTALAVSFDRNIGHDWSENSDDRYAYYHTIEEKIPFDLEMLNLITNGGITRKTLNVFLGGCVHPDTSIRVRIKRKSTKTFYEERDIKISKVKALIDEGFDIEVTSPDGWVGIGEFVDKGMYEEYYLSCNSRVVRCNGDHLFETSFGWKKAKDILSIQYYIGHDLSFLCEDGKLHSGSVEKPGGLIPIVDIVVEHENHRYYTNGISSHNTGTGKSMALCHLAAGYLTTNLNVLYITMEMSEEKIAERIDANLFDTNINELKRISRGDFRSKVQAVKAKSKGRLIVKEYPTAAAHTGHFRALINELRLKKNFEPDVIIVDYINICASSRIKGMGGSINSYSYIKAIAEELRGLAIETNTVMWSATQTNREGMKNSDVDLTNTSESFGLPATADLMLALIVTEELEELNQMLIKQLKNRYNDVSYNRRFVLGVDRPKMRFYDAEQSAQANLSPDSNNDQGGTHEFGNSDVAKHSYAGFEV